MAIMFKHVYLLTSTFGTDSPFLDRSQMAKFFFLKLAHTGSTRATTVLSFSPSSWSRCTKARGSAQRHMGHVTVAAAPALALFSFEGEKLPQHLLKWHLLKDCTSAARSSPSKGGSHSAHRTEDHLYRQVMPICQRRIPLNCHCSIGALHQWPCPGRSPCGPWNHLSRNSSSPGTRPWRSTPPSTGGSVPL